MYNHIWKNVFFCTFYQRRICLQKNNSSGALWNDDLYLLITYCTFSPHEIGLTAKKLQVAEKLPTEINNLLTALTKNSPEARPTELRQNFLNEAQENAAHFTEIWDIVHLKKDIHKLKQFVDGLFILKGSNFVDFEKEVVPYLSFPRQTTKNIMGVN